MNTKLYKVKTVFPKEDAVIKKSNESVLKDLLSIMPTLRKHKMEGDLKKKIITLREGRKKRAYSIEVSRKFNGVTLKASAPVENIIPKSLTASHAEGGKKLSRNDQVRELTRRLSRKDHIETVKKLKDDIVTQIKVLRKKQLPVMEVGDINGVTVTKLDYVYMEAGSFMKAFNKKLRVKMTQVKKPSTDGRFVGIEIEVASKIDIEPLCDQLFELGLAKYITVKHDGSINVDETYKYKIELNILARESEYEEVVTKVCQVLNKDKQTRVDKSCGLHVHLDMRSRDHVVSFHNLVGAQHFMYAMLPANRRASRYSIPVRGQEWREQTERYFGVNGTAFNKFKTLELRMHCGTTQADKINNWVAMLVSIVNAPKLPFVPLNVDDFARLCGLSETVVKYVKGRIMRFADQHATFVPARDQLGVMPNIEPLVTAERDMSRLETSEVA